MNKCNSYSIFNIYNCFRSHLAGPDFDVKVVPLVGDLEDFGPSEPVDPQPVSVDEQATCTNSQHDLHTLRVLGTTHTSRNDTKTLMKLRRNVSLR